eukprot:CAMPEP_0175870406 /NCGR_PEP_ID=MMETSP0107_2-20121207/36540_1 /TAXON_ID=195067 ORGANISM="Goniomonas pacifica, Strain CCMP1869" /NCGR_SAMPLE_ID=MMETSP0107_2 /ASSEMBLY_ACC=CAM_ASM_000203 /LENGTH=589 /DNA_ID=CAMNT_0017188627 /DNA_START=12 /DNA_END=1781 /DNA_ORIENTATION=+
MATDNRNNPQEDGLFERGLKIFTPEKTPKPLQEAEEVFHSFITNLGETITDGAVKLADHVSDGVKRLTSEQQSEENNSPTTTSRSASIPEESLYSIGSNQATKRTSDEDPFVSRTPKESDIPPKQDILSAGSTDAPLYDTTGLADPKVLEGTSDFSGEDSSLDPEASGNLSVDSVSGLKGRLIDDGPASSVSLGVDSSAGLASRIIDDDLASVPLDVESLASYALTERMIDVSTDLLNSGSSVSFGDPSVSLNGADLASVAPREAAASSEGPSTRMFSSGDWDSFNEGDKAEDEEAPFVHGSRNSKVLTAASHSVTNNYRGGSRHDNEDRSLIVSGVNGDALVVLDGHGGEDTVDMAKAALRTRLSRLLARRDKVDWPAELETAFVETDVEILAQYPTGRSGSCCCACVIIGNQMYIATVGDCTAMLISKSGKPEFVGVSHKPDLPEETARIERVGGFVTGNGRLCGILAVSRAFGDIDFKRTTEEFDTDPSGPARAYSAAPRSMSTCVTAVPTVQLRTLTSDDAFLVVASDGLGDGLNGDEVSEAVTTSLGGSVSEAAMLGAVLALCNKAVDGKRSHDDVTVILSNLG